MSKPDCSFTATAYSCSSSLVVLCTTLTSNLYVVVIIRSHRTCICTEYRRDLLLHRLWRGLSACLFVIHANTAEPIEVRFGMWTPVSPSNNALNGSPDLSGEGVFWGREAVRHKV